VQVCNHEVFAPEVLRGIPQHPISGQQQPILSVPITHERLRITVIPVSVEFDDQPVPGVGKVGASNEPSIAIPDYVLLDRFGELRAVDDPQEVIRQRRLIAPFPLTPNLH
jgi:hypothetical protein